MSKDESVKKVSIVPIEGDSQNPITAMYNPKELSFTKSASWSADNAGAETDCPALQFTAGQAITLNIELLFDYYEENGDVRGDVQKIVHLCEVQDCEGQKRPPRIQLVWADSNAIGIGRAFYGVVETAQAKYTMFTSEGIPCRASVTVSIKQADAIKGSGGASSSGTVKEYNLSGMSSASAANTPGMKEALEENGSKIDDKSTWPDTISFEPPQNS